MVAATKVKNTTTAEAMLPVKPKPHMLHRQPLLNLAPVAAVSNRSRARECKSVGHEAAKTKENTFDQMLNGEYACSFIRQSIFIFS